MRDGRYDKQRNPAGGQCVEQRQNRAADPQFRTFRFISDKYTEYTLACPVCQRTVITVSSSTRSSGRRDPSAANTGRRTTVAGSYIPTSMW